MNKSTCEWTEGMNARFLKKLESYPCLWNRTSRNFTNPASKAAALYKLSRHMNLPGCGAELMQRKVLELKAAFAREKRRMYEVRKDGGEFIPRFRWYRIADNFWGKIIRIRRLSFYSDDEANPVTSSVSIPLIDPRKANNDDALTTCLNKAVNAIRHVAALSDGNEFDAFGRCVAIQLKKMSPRSAYELQAEIQSIISKKKIYTLSRRVNRDRAPASAPVTVPVADNEEPDVWVRTGKDTFEACRIDKIEKPME